MKLAVKSLVRLIIFTKRVKISLSLKKKRFIRVIGRWSKCYIGQCFNIKVKLLSGDHIYFYVDLLNQSRVASLLRKLIAVPTNSDWPIQKSLTRQLDTVWLLNYNLNDLVKSVENYLNYSHFVNCRRYSC